MSLLRTLDLIRLMIGAFLFDLSLWLFELAET
jgi:hypothetical protein